MAAEKRLNEIVGDFPPDRPYIRKKWWSFSGQFNGLWRHKEVLRPPAIVERWELAGPGDNFIKSKARYHTLHAAVLVDHVAWPLSWWRNVTITRDPETAGIIAHTPSRDPTHPCCEFRCRSRRQLRKKGQRRFYVSQKLHVYYFENLEILKSPCSTKLTVITLFMLWLK